MNQALTPSQDADFANEPTRPGGSRADDEDRDGRPVLGARPVPGGTRFGLFCTTASSCQVRLFSPSGEAIADHALEPGPEGHFEVEVPGVGPGTLYKFVLDGRELPDPYARFLP